MSSGFISEADLAERRKVKKEQWMTTRKEGDPEEPPEEPEVFDHRTLYERLEEQKQKKQDEWEEAHKLKNMVRGLEDDEVDFLEFVDNTKLQEERRIRIEEKKALEEFRQKVADRQPKESELLVELRNNNKKPATTSSGKRKSQLSLLAGAIKRKSPDDEAKNPKVLKTSESPPKTEPSISEARTGALKCIAVLPGLGEYTDSSDSSDSDSEISNQGSFHYDMAGRKIIKQDGDACC